MSEFAVQQILACAQTDPTFRQLLLSRPDQALAGYSLTADEALMLQMVVQEMFPAKEEKSSEQTAKDGESSEQTGR